MDSEIAMGGSQTKVVIGGVRPIFVRPERLSYKAKESDTLHTEPEVQEKPEVQEVQSTTQKECEIVSKRQISDRRNKFFKAMVDRSESVEVIVDAMRTVDSLISAKRFNEAMMMMYPKKEFRQEFAHLPQEVQSRLSVNRYMTMKNYQKRYSDDEVMARMKVYDLKALEKVAKRMNESK